MELVADRPTRHGDDPGKWRKCVRGSMVPAIRALLSGRSLTGKMKGLVPDCLIGILTPGREGGRDFGLVGTSN